MTKERPILFSASMVRAILAGAKTQTRRAVKGLFLERPEVGTEKHPIFGLCFVSREAPDATIDWTPCPYGLPGDRLWVRENGWMRPYRTPKMMREGADTWAPYYYDADGENADDLREWGFKRRPSIHMPRWASRITLEITDIRVERVRDISEEDAIAEGVKTLAAPEWASTWRDTYLRLFFDINQRAPRDSNPWVWVVEFRRVA